MVNIVCLRLSLAKQEKKIHQIQIKHEVRMSFQLLNTVFMYEYILGGDSGRGWLVVEVPPS